VPIHIHTLIKVAIKTVFMISKILSAFVMLLLEKWWRALELNQVLIPIPAYAIIYI
jgi:hypothetical protein